MVEIKSGLISTFDTKVLLAKVETLMANKLKQRLHQHNSTAVIDDINVSNGVSLSLIGTS